MLEEETACLKVVLTKPRDVRWKKGGESISLDDERLKASSSSDSRLEHELTISAISTEDNGTFTAEVDDGDYGTITSSAKITVKGIARFIDFRMQSLL